MIEELDLVVLLASDHEHGLRAGDVGTVVHCYKDHAAFEVEFVNGKGDTLGVLTLTASQIRPQAAREVLHTREVALPVPE